MCTAISFKTNDHYFGRTLDMYFSYDQKVVITPRNYPFVFRKAGEMNSHFAMIGMAIESEGYPLYFDATNEKGLSIAGLNFPENCVYKPIFKDKINIAPFEVVPWILGQFQRVSEVKKALCSVNIADIDFSSGFSNTSLHWLVSDKNYSITVEAVESGLQVYDNPVGVLTNNPPFEMQMWNLNNYMNITCKPPVNRFSHKIELKPYSFGLGGRGLPGDLSSSSRFVRATFTKLNSVCGKSENESISQFFRILGAVVQQKGCAMVEEDKYETTIYSSCCNTNTGVYYYTTYKNNSISAVEMFNEDLDSDKVMCYPLPTEHSVSFQNKKTRRR